MERMVCHLFCDVLFARLKFALFSTGNLDAFIVMATKNFARMDAKFHGEQRRRLMALGPNVPIHMMEVVRLVFISLSNNRTNAMTTTITTSHSHTTTDILPESQKISKGLPPLRSNSNTGRL